MDSELVALGKRLREARRSAPGDPTLATMARELDVSESYVSQLEKGKKQPSWRHLKQMAVAYGTTTDALLGLGDNATAFLVHSALTSGELPSEIRNLLAHFGYLSDMGRDLLLRLSELLVETETRQSSAIYTEWIVRAMVSDEEWALIESARALARTGDEIGARRVVDDWLSRRNGK